MDQKHLQSIYHVNVNVNLTEDNVIQINGGITRNVDVSPKNIYQKDIWNPAICSWKNGKYLASIIDDPVIM